MTQGTTRRQRARGVLLWAALPLLGFSLPACQRGPLTLELDPTVVQDRGLPDRSAEAEKRTTWDNFKANDTLNQQHQVQVNPPKMILVAEWGRYEADPIGAILHTGKVDFWHVSEMYRKGVVSRDRRAEIWGEMQKRMAETPDDPAIQSNAVAALIHIGFDEEAFDLISRYSGEDWWKSSWDANFYAGSLMFRYGRYADAVPYLETALALHPDLPTRLWLSAAMAGTGDPAAKARAVEVFPWGKHLEARPPAELPFRDMSDRLGLRRWGLAGAVNFPDLDNDTWPDLVGQGAFATPEWYRFTPGTGYVRQSSPVLDDIFNVPPGGAAADFDNDGFVDLYMTQAAWFMNGPNRLLKNDGGKGWIDKSMEGDAALMQQNSCGVAALDYDHDGLLDLAVSGTAGGTLRLLKNTGGMVFKDVTAAAGIIEDAATTVGLAVGDLTGDGWPDIFTNSFSPTFGGRPGSGSAQPDRLYVNQGNGTFKEEGEARGVAGGTPMGFSAWTWDYDLDGDLDILATNFARPEDQVLRSFVEPLFPAEGFQPVSLWQNDGTGHFVDVAGKAGIKPLSIMGAMFVDWDLDGDPDLVLGPGSHPLPQMQPLFFYRNDGPEKFTLLTDFSNPAYFGKFHGMAFTDVDRDGDPDLYVTNGGILLSDRWRDLFLENTTSGKHWLHLHLFGTTSNRSAVGARVEVPVGGRTLVQEVAVGQGFSSTNTPYLIFGMGDSAATDEGKKITIRWPSGLVQELPRLAADQAIEVTEGSGTLRRVY
jgi:hypothetical protein